MDEEELQRLCGGRVPSAVRDLYDRWKAVWNRTGSSICNPQVLALIVAIATEPVRPPRKTLNRAKKDEPKEEPAEAAA